MANVIYKGGNLQGRVLLPPSKSVAHRAVLCAALSGGECLVENVDMNDDLTATTQAAALLGVHVEYEGNTRKLFLKGGAKSPGECVFDCLESGSTLRFLIPVAAALGKKSTFIGRGRLPQRPLGIYETLLPAHGITWESEGGLPLSIEGKLQPGEFCVPGNVSSQFITGLMLALPLLERDSTISLTTPLESKGYVDLTISVLRNFGIRIEETERGWAVPGRQRYTPGKYTVEGDWSQAAFYLCMAALSPTGQKICLEGLSDTSVQGDRECLSLFKQFGLRYEVAGNMFTFWNPKGDMEFGGLQGITINAAQIPDMVPALAVCAACARGTTRIQNAQRLRLKESDRLAAMEEAINALGGQAVATEDGLEIQGVPLLAGGKAAGKKDHRIVMALAAASLRSAQPVEVTDGESIRKSYPEFFRDFRSIGGIADVVSLG